MKDKIEVGEFVRTYDGDIFKFGGYFKDKDCMKDENGLLCGSQKKCCKKHSKNIIDIIEVGDYVNGELVREPIDNGIWAYGICEGIEQFKRAYGDIKSIVTKEQFESMRCKYDNS